jgi:hypothetical protein
MTPPQPNAAAQVDTNFPKGHRMNVSLTGSASYIENLGQMEILAQAMQRTSDADKCVPTLHILTLLGQPRRLHHAPRGQLMGWACDHCDAHPCSFRSLRLKLTKEWHLAFWNESICAYGWGEQAAQVRPPRVPSHA